MAKEYFGDIVKQRIFRYNDDSIKEGKLLFMRDKAAGGNKGAR